MTRRAGPGFVVLAAAALAALVLAAPASALAGDEVRPHRGPRLALLPFADEAGFQGDWHLGQDVPRLLADQLSALSSLRVLDVDSVWAADRSLHVEDARRAVAVGKAVAADFVLSGVVRTCGVRRVLAGDPNLGGYRSFTYALSVDEVDLTRVASGAVVRTLSVARDSVIRPLELNLFGRPTEQDREFEQLFKVAFGSQAFDELGFGRFVRATLADLAADVVGTIYNRPPLILSREGARVLAVDAQRIFLGIGVEDHLELGDVVPILDGEGERVALVEIVQIIGPHLSAAVPLGAAAAGGGSVEVGQRIGQRLAPDMIPD